MTPPASDVEYEEFCAYPDRAGADAMCSLLVVEGVPSFVQSRSLENALETDFVVWVASRLAHRARWVAAQLPPSEAELTFLATGKLPAQD